jgi:CheY-like chemotaxis protein
MSGESSYRAGPSARARLLLIDDDVALGRVIARMLRDDHDVTVLTNAREALKRIAEGERYDAILCDLLMPDLTGMDMHEKLEQIDAPSARRVLFLSGGAVTPHTVEFLRSVDNPHLEKPFDRAALLAAVAVVLDGRPARGT